MHQSPPPEVNPLFGTYLVRAIEDHLGRRLNDDELAWLESRHAGIRREQLPMMIEWFKPISLVRAAMLARHYLGRVVTPVEYERLKAWFPDHRVSVWMVESIAEKLNHAAPELRLVK
jgi:hypothetical protein